ncbi:MAG: aa3-type cytochrome oxidase subunit IV [Mycobacteriales bacterium]
MKVEGYVFGFLFAFLAVSDVVYWFLSHDPTGTTALALAAGLGLLISFYMFVTGRRLGLRPEDRGDADVSEGAGVVGHFSPGSPWPVLIAFSAAVFFLGFVYGLWLSVLGGIGMLVNITGLLFEHFVGQQSEHANEVLH